MRIEIVNEELNMNGKVIERTYKLDNHDNPHDLIRDKLKEFNEDNALVCNSDVWELNHKISETEKFNLKVSFPKEYNSSEIFRFTEL